MLNGRISSKILPDSCGFGLVWIGRLSLWVIQSIFSPSGSSEFCISPLEFIGLAVDGIGLWSALIRFYLTAVGNDLVLNSYHGIRCAECR